MPAFVRWPGRFPAGMTLNGIVSHQDWLPTFAAAAGAPDIKEQLLKGSFQSGGRSYRNMIDGFDMLDYLSGSAKDSPRPYFFYVNDDGEIVAVRWNDWKVVYKENRGEAFGVWREPFTTLRVPLLSTCVAIPSSARSTTRTPRTTGSSTASTSCSAPVRWRPGSC